MAKSEAEKQAEKAAKQAEKEAAKAAKEAEKAAKEEADFQASLEGLSDEERDAKIAEREAEQAEDSKESDEFPEGEVTGRFHSVAHKEGFVVYNPNGARVSGVLSDAKATDLVTRMNADAHIKAKK